MVYPEIEIGFHRQDTASYAVQVRFRDPEDEAEQRADVYPMRFAFETLRGLQNDPAAYGMQLGKDLLGNPDVRSCLDKARTVAQNTQRRLRLRLSIDRWSLELHDLRWETLRDPETGRSLLTDDNILFSRYLASFDMRPVRLRSKTDLRALVAVANPQGLAQWKPGGRALAPIDAAGELARARQGLGNIEVVELAGATHVTLDALTLRLREDFDILYLVCHGALIEQEPRLWLEDDSGNVKVTTGTELVEVLARLIRLPRLVVLASCQSGGTGEEAHSEDEGVLAALGPRLAEAGIPAVVAMQGNVRQKTVAAFMPVFFRELLKDGQIDRALGEARFAARGEPDHWAPVLYSRLATGRLWYEQRLSGTPGFDTWAGLINQIRKGKCVPILGSGLLEPYVGSTREIARRWARTHQYPMANSPHYDLPQVAEYLSTTQGADYPRDEFVRELSDEILRRWPALDEPETQHPLETPANKLLRLLSAAHAASDRPVEPFRVLAKLDCPLYVTMNPDNLLADALFTAGKTPREELCRWQETGEAASGPSVLDLRQPLIYQLFGHLSDVETLVLTEDDYFRYLIGITRLQNRPQPSVIQQALAQSGLMFLGFRIDDWDFRVFVRFLNSRENVALRRNRINVAVQIDPEEGLGSDPARVRRYLERYFNAPDMHIEIYWGSVEDFLEELNRRWQT